MNHPADSSPAAPQPAVTAQGLAALVKHLRRSGVAFLPTPDPAAVAAMVSASAEPVAAATATAAAPPLPSDSPAAARPAFAAAPLTAGPAAAATGAARSAAAGAAGSGPAVRTGAAAATSPAAEQPLAEAVELRLPYAGPSLPVAERAERLEQLAQQVADCPRCEALVCSRKQTVFGEGDPAARVCFFGEAPGAEEDATGRPFVGKSGMLLTKMIEACTFTREQVYILNTIKCRPPGNRNPAPEEIASCRPYFEQQLEIIRPQYIVCLGLVAAQTLLGSSLSIGRLRGRFHPYRDSQVVATYHPSYLLRNPAAKREAWKDLQMLMRAMGIESQR